ncbi:hypothetical protein BKA82DRAFT_1004414, partial [Pisolithus tinctorius]
SIPAIGCPWLGIAQLCLLLIVLVLMGFTRGAPYVEQFLRSSTATKLPTLTCKQVNENILTNTEQ